MAKLIEDSEFQEIRDLANDLVETFGQRQITYRLYQDDFNRMNRDNINSKTHSDKVLNGVVVWLTDKSEMIESERTGSVDFSDGYVILSYDECVTNEMIDGTTKKVYMSAPRDLIAWEGVEYYIEGLFLVGQLKDKETIVKVYFRKKEKPIS